MLKKLKSILSRKERAEPPKPRASRLDIFPLYDVTFEPRSESEARLNVANLSESGIGLIPQPSMGIPTKGEMVHGFLHFPEARFPVLLRVAYAAKEAIGCAFEGETSALQETILKCFSHELAAKDMIEVNSEILKEEKEGRPRLFRGRRNCELFFIENEGKIVRFQLSFFGNYIEGGEEKPTRFGFLCVSETDRLQYKGSALVRLTSELAPEALQGAVKLLENIESLTAEQREVIRIMIRHGR